jgi:hypothetical protein
MNLKDKPRAYWAFQTDFPKEAVRNLMQSITLKLLKMQKPDKITQWRVNLFRKEEFDKYKNDTEAIKTLKPLRGWKGPAEETHLFSTSDMKQSYLEAQNYLEGDIFFKQFVKEAKGRNLNYLVLANHNGNLQNATYNGSTTVMDLIKKISSDMLNMIPNKKSQLCGHYEDSEKVKFVISNGLEKNIPKNLYTQIF